MSVIKTPPMGKLETALYELGHLLSCERHGHIISGERKHMQKKAACMLEVEQLLAEAMADHASAALEMGVGL